ncbi:MAG: hypothetical protein ACK5L5_04225 [Bacteroidales bacterium]
MSNLLAKHDDGTSIRRRIFDKYIAPIVAVSYAQFSNMLNERNPRKQLEEVEREMREL